MYLYQLSIMFFCIKMGTEDYPSLALILEAARLNLIFFFAICVCYIGVPGVLSVRADPDFHSVKKDYDPSNVQSVDLPSQETGTTLLFPMGNTQHWLVRMDKPGIGVVSKAQMVDYYAQILAKVLGK